MVRMSQVVMAALFMGGAAAPPHQGQPQLKLAYVNSQVILQSTPGTAQAESTLQREVARYQRRITALQQRYDSAVGAYNRTALALTAAVKQQRQQELAQMQQRAAQVAQELHDSAQAKQQELMAPISQRITAVIEGIRAEYNYAIVFDVAAQQGVIVAADGTLDISRLVIQRLQAGATPGAARPPE